MANKITEMQDKIAQVAQDASGAAAILLALAQCDVMEPDALRLVADKLDADAQTLHDLLDE